MMGETQDLDSVIRRLQKLEKENRRLKRAALVVLLAVGALVLMGQRPAGGIIAGNKFVLRDSGGRKRAVLSVDPLGPSLDFYDPDGTLRVTLGSGVGGTKGYQISDQLRARLSKKEATTLSTLESLETGAGLRLYGTHGKTRMVITADATGSAVILTGPQSATINLNMDKSGPLLDLVGPGGHAETSLAVDADGSTLSVADSNGYSAVIGNEALVTPATGETHRTSAASVVLFDKDKSVIWSSP